MQPMTHAGGPPLGGVVGLESVEILPANPMRGYFVIFNTHDSGTIYLSLSRGLYAPEVGFGIAIGPKESYSINALNMYRDSIEAIADADGVTWCGMQGGAG